MRNPQLSMRFTAEPDPRYCAKAFCRVSRRKKPTHAVTLGKQSFLLCSSCARPYETVRGAKVTKITPEVANAS